MRLSNHQANDPFFAPTSLRATAKAQSGRFYLDGLNTPIRAEVAHQDAAGMTIRQELPFLQLQGRLRDENGREGSLENVSVTLRNGVPALVLDIRYEGGRNDATVPFLMESTRAMRATHSLLRRNADASRPMDEAMDATTGEAMDETTTYEAGRSFTAVDPRYTGDADASTDAIEALATFEVREPRSNRRDETLPYGIRTGENAEPIEPPPLPTVEDLMEVTSAPLAPRRRRSGRNGWWARLWQRMVLRLRS